MKPLSRKNQGLRRETDLPQGAHALRQPVRIRRCGALEELAEPLLAAARRIAGPLLDVAAVGRALDGHAELRGRVLEQDRVGREEPAEIGERLASPAVAGELLEVEVRRRCTTRDVEAEPALLVHEQLATGRRMAEEVPALTRVAGAWRFDGRPASPTAAVRSMQRWRAVPQLVLQREGVSRC